MTTDISPGITASTDAGSRDVPKLRWVPQVVNPQSAWNVVRRGEATAVQRLLERHGGVVSVSIPRPIDVLGGVRRVVLVGDPTLVKPLLTASEEQIDSTRANWVTEMAYGDRSMFLIDGPDHLRLRRLVLPRLRGGELDKWGAGLESALSREIAHWPRQCSVPVHERMLDVGLQSILEITLGLTHDDMPEWQESMHLLLKTALSNQVALRYALRNYGAMRTWRSFNRYRADADALVYSEIAHRKATPEIERNDLLDLMMDIDGEPLSDKELRDQVFTILLAGHETTATTVTWALTFLLSNPGAMTKAVEEARGGSGEDTYIGAVVNETLRLHAPVPVVGRVTRTEFNLGPYRLPPETLILPAIDTIHRQASLYPDPDVFRPERFLDTRPGMYTLIPFGGGQHRCLGDRLAMFQAKIMLQNLLRTLDVEQVGRLRSLRSMLPDSGLHVRAQSPRGAAS